MEKKYINITKKAFQNKRTFQRNNNQHSRKHNDYSTPLKNEQEITKQEKDLEPQKLVGGRKRIAII